MSPSLRLPPSSGSYSRTLANLVPRPVNTNSSEVGWVSRLLTIDHDSSPISQRRIGLAGGDAGNGEFVICWTDRPEITLPPRKRLGINLGPRYEFGESSAVATTRLVGGRRADYGFVGTMDTKIRRRRAEEVGYGLDGGSGSRETVDRKISCDFRDATGILPRQSVTKALEFFESTTDSMAEFRASLTRKSSAHPDAQWRLVAVPNLVMLYYASSPKMAPREDHELNPCATQQPHVMQPGMAMICHTAERVPDACTMLDAIEFATELMDKKINTWAERQADNKRKETYEAVDLCVPNVTITVMVLVLPNATKGCLKIEEQQQPGNWVEMPRLRLSVAVGNQGRKNCTPSSQSVNFDLPGTIPHLSLMDCRGIHLTLSKIESIKIGALLNTNRDCRQFYGPSHYYRRFIRRFSKIAKSMTKLTQKGVKFDWGDKQEAAFQLLKQKLCSAPILALPKGSEDFIAVGDVLIAYCDASKEVVALKIGALRTEPSARRRMLLLSALEQKNRPQGFRPYDELLA
ncbi:hypothetical protein Tco_0051343 [Tanacetum coccineum]